MANVTHGPESGHQDISDRAPGDHRFLRANRLLQPSSFQRVFNQPDYKVGGRYFLFLARENQTPLHRLGLVIGRKRAKRAVDRGLAKRQLRESFRQRPEQLAGLDIVVILRGNLDHPDAAILRTEIDSLWDKLLAKRHQA
ncbi:MAG: ribonuclease P protein component [Alcanivorax sp.]|nr:ribonuclease P protein component [Alcanivorax sp.]